MLIGLTVRELCTNVFFYSTLAYKCAAKGQKRKNALEQSMN